MSQLRLDPLTGRWVVISVTRAARAESFLPRSIPPDFDGPDACPFCPGLIELEPAAVIAPNGDGVIRIVANKYPAFAGVEPMAVENVGPVFTMAPASGIHEVLVFHQDHHGSYADLSAEQAAMVMRVIRDRIHDHSNTSGLRYSQAILNHGREAGASMTHPHWQLMGLPFVPGEIHEEMAGFARFEGNCLICTTLEAEIANEEREIYQDDDVVIAAPYWSGTPYEMLVMPRQHDSHITDSPTEVVEGVGKGLRLALGGLKKLLGDVPYNVVLHSSPYNSQNEFHWHLHILPKLATRAGFELGTGVLINVMPPESAADELRHSITE